MSTLSGSLITFEDRFVIFIPMTEQNNPADFHLSGESSAATSPVFPLVREGRYLWILLGLLMSVTVFEAYDTTIFHLCTRRSAGLEVRTRDARRAALRRVTRGSIMMIAHPRRD